MPPKILRVLTARRGLSVFLGSVLCLAAWQVWLTWRLMDQDRNLELQRSRERVGQLADIAVAQLAGSLGDWDRSLEEVDRLPPLPSWRGRLPPNSTLVLISQGSVEVYPQRALLFSPILPAEPSDSGASLEAIDQMELRDQRYDAAIAALQPLIHRPDTRSEALLRLARIEYKANRKEAALATYKSLETETAVNDSGAPYGVLALTSRCRILRELGHPQEALSEAGTLRDGLLEGKWPLSRDAFQYYWSELEGLGFSSGPPPESSIDFANLISSLSSQWQTAKSQSSSSRGRKLQADSSLLLWNARPERLAALLAPAGWLDSSLKLPATGSDIQWRLLPTGYSASQGVSATRSLAEVQLPARLEFFSRGPLSNAMSNRRAMWFAGAALMAAVILGSGYVLQRALRRELQVARLQSDFVAAVSHEFRSPLTTLRTITELLAQDRIRDEARRRQSYVFLEHETIRLHRLVEDLLDFGRMESGRKQYNFAIHDAFQIVRAAVADVADAAATNGFRIEVRIDPIPAPVRADEEAFRRAVRNLLENAMKYSPVCRTIWVAGTTVDRRISISVRDQGMGIDASEQKAIFQKFVRGHAAKKAGIKGTGIGLSMVQQISEAMGGEIALQSTVNAGSTFAIMLPLADS